MYINTNSGLHKRDRGKGTIAFPLKTCAKNHPPTLETFSFPVEMSTVALFYFQSPFPSPQCCPMLWLCIHNHMFFKNAAYVHTQTDMYAHTGTQAHAH